MPNTNKIIIKTKNKIDIIDKSDIIYIEADRSYCVLYCSENKRNTLTCSKPLNFFEAQLLENNFIRCHRSFLVNLNTIQTINRSKKSILLNNGKEIPVSKSNLKIIIDYFDS